MMSGRGSLMAKISGGTFWVGDFDSERRDREHMRYVFPFIILSSVSLSFLCCNVGLNFE
jgi:hypothetical protein